MQAMIFGLIIMLIYIAWAMAIPLLFPFSRQPFFPVGLPLATRGPVRFSGLVPSLSVGVGVRHSPEAWQFTTFLVEILRCARVFFHIFDIYIAFSTLLLLLLLSALSVCLSGLSW